MRYRTRRQMRRMRARRRRARATAIFLLLVCGIVWGMLKFSGMKDTSAEETKYWPEQQLKSDELVQGQEEAGDISDIQDKENSSMEEKSTKTTTEIKEDSETAVDEVSQEQKEPSVQSIQEDKKYSLEGTTYPGEEDQTVNNGDDLLVLVNKDRGLESHYEPKDLVEPDIDFPYNENSDSPAKMMRKEAAKALEEMFQGAEEEGIMLYGVSAYRSYADQEQIFQSKVTQLGEEEAKKWAADPGHSEHQTGLAIDITGRTVVRGESSTGFEGTKEAKWVAENSYKYGYILRYPKDKEDITKYHYEPWHVRYIGKEAAKEVFDNHFALEELFQ